MCECANGAGAKAGKSEGRPAGHGPAPRASDSW